MGERVVIDPRRMTEPVEAIPLEYGHGGRATDAWRSVRARAGVVWEAFRTSSGAAADDLKTKLVPALGGWRQVLFALGLAFVLGGLGLSVGSGDGAIPMWLGGLLVGFVVRVPGARAK
jgi:hypothetical protein